MKTAEEWANDLTDKWEVGTSSQFCDEVDWDSADINLISDFIKQIQLDAMREGMRRAAKALQPYLNHEDWQDVDVFQQTIIDSSEQLTEKDL